MKSIKILFLVSSICFLILMSGIFISSCKKTNKTPPDTIDLKTGLVAYYNFNGGNLNDSSGLNNNIVYNNATKTTDRFGNANNAYLFDGDSNYMKIKNSSSLNPEKITIFAIIKVNGFYTGPCNGNEILSKGYPYNINGFYDMGYVDPAANCGTPDLNNESFGGGFGDNDPMGSSATAGTDSIKVKTGQWYYLTFTYDDTTAKFYINGLLKDSRPKSAVFTANTFDLFIGKHENPSFPYYINGVIDELRIYNRALPEAAVLHLNDLKN